MYKRKFRPLQQIFHVQCPTCGTHETSHVDFVNVEEDIQGRDIMTYRCPVSNEIHSSVVVQAGWR